mmetsp:Transcript_1222/g.2905  ORF Transcript_1222/g.2905 Transcript_1222/m.2905 type:complete len:335 (-) Transcript_1222:153-1157(-)
MPSSRNLGGAMRRPSRLLALQVKQLFPALCLLLVAVEAGRNRPTASAEPRGISLLAEDLRERWAEAASGAADKGEERARDATLRRLPLPEGLIALASSEGQTIFQHALAGQGNMKPFFPLMQELQTQETESECGVATMLTILNALGVDPGSPWAPGVPDWDWYGGIDMLKGLEYHGLCPGGGTCCVPRDLIDIMGLCLNQWECIAQANSLHVDTKYWGTFAVQDLRDALHAMNETSVIALNFDRRGVGQQGGGHFSPIAGYSAERDMVLVLDVARYKYVPFWAPTDKVYGAMSTDYFGSTRGFAVVHVNPAGPVMPQQQEECTLKPPGGLRDTE